MTKTRVPADVYDQLERISLGMYGRKNSPGGFRDNERDDIYWGSGKPDGRLARELLETLEKDTQ